MRETWVQSLGWGDPPERGKATHSSILAWSQRAGHDWVIFTSLGGFSDSSVGKESTCNAGDPSSTPGLGRSSAEGIAYTLQYSWLPLWLSWLRIRLQCRRPRFDLWVGKTPWRRERLPTPVLWPGEFHGLYCPWGCKESDMTEWLSLSVFTFLVCYCCTCWIRILFQLKCF